MEEDKGGFLTRSTSAPDSETKLTKELLQQWIDDLSKDEFQVPVHYLTSREEYLKIMSSPLPYYKVMRQLLGIKEPNGRTDD